MTLKNHSLDVPGRAKKEDPLEGLDDNALLALRNRIDSLLTVDIDALNLTEELGLQYRAGKALLASLGDDTPANQRAQVFNAVSAMLTKIIEQRKMVASAERLKRYEAAFLKTLEALADDTARAVFIDLYQEFLDDRGN